MKKTTINKDYFKVIDTSNKAYFIGMIYADGNLYEKRKRILINLKQEDGYILEQLRKDIEYTGKLHVWKKGPPRQNQNAISIYNEEIYEDLKKLGLSENKTLKVNDPIIPEKYFFDFLRGFFDGDGTISRSNKNSHVSIVCLKSMFTYISNILKIYGISSTFIIPKNKYRIKDLGYLKINKKKEVKLLMDKMYHSENIIYMKRKYNIFHKAYIVDEIHNFEKYSGKECFIIDENNNIINTFFSFALAGKFLGISKSAANSAATRTLQTNRMNCHRLVCKKYIDKIARTF